MISVGHVGPEKASVYQTHKNNMTLRCQSGLEEPESCQCVVIKQLSGGHVLWVLSACTDVIT